MKRASWVEFDIGRHPRHSGLAYFATKLQVQREEVDPRQMSFPHGLSLACRLTDAAMDIAITELQNGRGVCRLLQLNARVVMSE